MNKVSPKTRVVPVNNFGYSCIRQINCKVNNAETEAASGINLAYREYFKQLLEVDPWQERSTLKRQGWYRDVAGQMELFGAPTVNGTKNDGGLMREKALVGETGSYEFNINAIPCNFCQIEQNVPPNTKAELEVFFKSPKVCLVARNKKSDGQGDVENDSSKVTYDVDVPPSFIRVFYRVPQQQIMTHMEQ